MKTAVVMLLLGVSGCLIRGVDPARTAFERIQPGMSRDQVQQVMGITGAQRELALPAGPFWGPQEGLEKFIPPNTPFEEWQYTNAADVFLVWFWATNHAAKTSWRVIGKTRHERGAVF